jgi:hypothetical protein
VSGCNGRLTDELESISGKKEMVAEIFLEVMETE